MLRRQLFAFCLFASLGLSAQAQEAPANAPKEPQGVGRCTGPAEACQRLRERLDGYCKDNPQRCEEFKAKREAMRQKCSQDPAACEKERKERQAKAKERFEQRCKENPQRCEEMKKHWEERCAQNPQKCKEMKARAAEPQGLSSQPPDEKPQIPASSR